MFLTACLLSWIFGIFLSGYLQANILVFVLPLFFLLTGMVCGILIKRKCPVALLRTTLCLLLCMAGVLWYGSYEKKSYLDAVEFADSAPVALSGTIVSEVSRYDSTDYFYLKEDSGRKIRVTVHTQQPLLTGQHITLENPTLTPVNVANKKLQSTKKFMGNGAGLTAVFPYEATLRVNGVKNPALYYAKLARNKTKDLFYKLFPSEIASFLSSLLTSDQSGLSEELYQNFITTGSIHILVVSGMHFNYLISILLFLLTFLLPSRRQKLWFTLPLLLLFAVFTGGTLPVLRAFCMTSLLFFGEFCYLRREHSFLPVVGLAVIFLLISPTLIWNPSFLLTFGATLGITCFYKPLNEKLTRIPTDFLRSYIALQLSVQVFTLPVTCYFFSRISKVSLLTNFLVSPLVPVVLILAMLLPLTAGIPLISTGMVWLTRWICTLFLWIIKATARLTEPLRFSCNEILFLILLFLSGGLFFLVYTKNRKQKTALLLVCLGVFGAGMKAWLLPPRESHTTLTFFGASNTQSSAIITEENRLILYGTMKDIRNARYSAAFSEGTPVALLILTDLSDAELLNEFLRTNPVEQVVLPAACRENWNSSCPVLFCSSKLTTNIDNLQITLITDKATFSEVECAYLGTLFSFTSDASYLLKNHGKNPDKYWIYNFRRTGKDARLVAALPAGERLFSKKPWHPDGRLYDNTSLIDIDQVGLSVQRLTE